MNVEQDIRNMCQPCFHSVGGGCKLSLDIAQQARNRFCGSAERLSADGQTLLAYRRNSEIFGEWYWVADASDSNK